MSQPATSTLQTRPDQVVVVGAGISGLAAARALVSRGASVKVVERSRVVGGRMASRRLNGRRVDLGASYFTSRPDAPFHSHVEDWLGRGLAREWTDTFSVGSPAGVGESKSGPMRYGTADGLRSLVADLAEVPEIEFQFETVVDRFDPDVPTILAMPDPQARRLLTRGDTEHHPLGHASEWESTIAVSLRFESRQWDADLHGVFVNDSPEIGFIADDGDRRGDGAPVLVIHSSPDLAREHLDDVQAALPAIRAAALQVLGIDAEPVETYVHRWTFAKPSDPHDEPYLLDEESRLGVCGDAWGGHSSISAAWTSGDALGRAFPLG